VNADLLRMAERSGGDVRIGATVVALLIQGEHWAVSWAGDSRAYLYRDGSLSQLTHDHTVAAALAEEGAMSRSNGEVTRAVGAEQTLELDQVSDLVSTGDRFLLCSDGLYGALPEARICECLAADTPEEASRELVDAACKAGAGDNVTALVVDVHPSQHGH
jgi:serine/threonine protein phosphatase Stp1